MKQKPHLTQNNYFNKVVALLNQTQPKLATQHNLEFKNVFGAVGGYVNNRIFISSGKFGVALKLPKEVLDGLFTKKNVKRLKYFSNGHVKKGYVILPMRILENKLQLKNLIDKSIQYALVKQN